MLSLRARLHRFFLRQLCKRIDGDSDVGDMRRTFDRLTRRLGPVKGVNARRETLGGIDATWLLPDSTDDAAPLLLYLHGGAYVMGSSNTHRRLVSAIARRAAHRALVPDYRLAPENPFPAGLSDCVAVYRALLDAGHDPQRITVAGDSAGGGMTLALLLSLRDAGLPQPRGAAVMSPWLDLTGSGESTVSRAKLDPMFRAADMPKASIHYAPLELQKDPRVSPVFADVAGLAPVCIQVGDCEILLSDSTRLADNLKAVGGDVELNVWPDLWHVFQFWAGRIPEADRAIDQLGDWIGAPYRSTPA